MQKVRFSLRLSGFMILLFGTTSLLFSGEAASYPTPIGIPAPSFGIAEQHTDYASKVFSAGGFSYRDAGNGPYSHYIDNASGSCNDSGNMYGTAVTPRCTIPTTLPAGSVVEIHGGPYSSLDLTRGVVGTAQYPIYIRGSNKDNKVVITGRTPDNPTVTVRNSSYLIVENFIADGVGLGGAEPSSAFNVKAPSDHIVVRQCEVKNYPMPDFCSTKGAACWNSALNSAGASYDGAAPTNARASNIVFYGNYIHDNADYPPSYETGRHGVMVAGGAEYVWILDNKIERSGDDGVQVYWLATGTKGPPANHVYIGGNEVQHMGENAFDVKQAYDVIISQNKVWGFRQTTQLGAGSDGAAIVLNNDEPSDRLWVLYNEIFDSNIGVRTQSHGTVYLIGNIIYDIIRSPDAVIPTSSTGSTSGCGIIAKSSPNLNIINNTFDHVDAGIYIVPVSGWQYDIRNNIISNLNETTSFSIAYSISDPPLVANNNLIYSSNGNAALKKVTCTDCVIGKDPLFVDSPNNDYRLKTGSPAFEKGSMSASYGRFFELYNLQLQYPASGAAKLFSSATGINAIIDIGAYRGMEAAAFGSPQIISIVPR